MTEVLKAQCISTRLSLVCVQTITPSDIRHKRFMEKAWDRPLKPSYSPHTPCEARVGTKR